jgi:hypothetical protein
MKREKQIKGMKSATWIRENLQSQNNNVGEAAN